MATYISGSPKPRHGNCTHFSVAFGQIFGAAGPNPRPPRRSGRTALRSLGVPALAAMLAAASSGCTVGPDFVPPPAPSATRYTSPAEATASDADAGPVGSRQTVTLGERVSAEWWTLFRSPEIDTLIKEAIAGSPTLESATARLTEAQEAVAAASGALYPQVDVSASVTRQKLNTSSFGLKPGSVSLPPNFNVYQVGPTVSYALDIFGGTRRQIEQKTASADVQRYQLDAAYQTLTGNIVTQAVQVAAARAQLQAIHDILDLDRQNLDLVRKARQAGSVPDTDVVTAQSQLATDETLPPGPAQQLDMAKHALAVLLGRTPGEWSPPDFDLASLTLPGQLPVSLPSQLVHQRPDILAAEAQLHVASAQIGIATAELYPAVTLSGSAGAAALDPGHLFNPAGLVWSIAAGLTEPVFDGGTRQADRRAAVAAFKASAADYRQTVLQAFSQVADILQALSHDAQLLAAQRQALDMASESIRLQRINYSQGGVGLLNLLDAQHQYQQALLGYVRAEVQRYQDTIQLLLAMGGGWWDANLTEAENNPAGRSAND
jgi:NodT family efflux transporter outer membrane factor (OMF) lipoprotein